MLLRSGSARWESRRTRSSARESTETWSGAHLSAGVEKTVPTPLAGIPVWVRSGGVVLSYPADDVGHCLGDVPEAERPRRHAVGRPKLDRTAVRLATKRGSAGATGLGAVPGRNVDVSGGPDSTPVFQPPEASTVGELARTLDRNGCRCGWSVLEQGSAPPSISDWHRLRASRPSPAVQATDKLRKPSALCTLEYRRRAAARTRLPRVGGTDSEIIEVDLARSTDM
jgi:hypothetical protein